MKVPTIGAVLYLLTAALLAGCGGGNYNGSATGDGSGSSGSNGAGTTTGGTGGGGSSGTGFATPQAFFQADVEPNLGFCRTCHVPGGVADTSGTSVATQGNLFLLSSDSSQDYDNLMASWTRLGKGVTDNKLHTYPSVPAQSHTGGQPWPVGSAPYLAMQTLLSCWDNPSGCAALIGGGDSTGNGGSGGTSGGTTTFPLLGSSHGGHLWGDYCEGKPDSAALPADPRSLIQPGVNQGKAVHFNVYWADCRAPVDPTYVAPKSCGDYRKDVTAGATLIKGNGAVGAGSATGGSSGDGLGGISVKSYNDLWRVWGLPGRPSNFDELAAQRYGFALSGERNPYPLTGEDPNKTNGGSGQLPMAFTQMRSDDGTWSGRLGITCSACHAGKVGTATDGPGLGALYGAAGQGDIEVLLRDIGNGIGAFLPFSDNKTRGTGGVTNFQAFVMLWLIGDKSALPGITLSSFVFAPATGTEDSPQWWNTGHRPVKFFAGAMPMDATRIVLEAYMPLLRASDIYNFPEIQAWTDAHDRQAEAWVNSVKAPNYPLPVNTALAEQGAILFHSKNLWAPNLNNPVPKPEGGNGSCASCHGAYSPRFVNDSTYLDAPAMEGIASYRVEANVIGTDPAYRTGQNQGVTDYFKYSWLFYPPSPGAPGVCYGSDQAQTYQGYVAPPLYGVWASAPYFHNGSVPNVWEVLKPSDRPAIWRRVSTPTPAGASSRLIMGYDTDLGRAYDSQRLGWNYDTLSCGDPGVTPFLDCRPGNPSADTLSQRLFAALSGTIGLSWNIEFPLMTTQQIEDRKIYNTHFYSQGNEGHEFTSVLTDAERAALIEYLKTL